MPQFQALELVDSCSTELTRNHQHTACNVEACGFDAGDCDQSPPTPPPSTPTPPPSTPTPPPSNPTPPPSNPTPPPSSPTTGGGGGAPTLAPTSTTYTPCSGTDCSYTITLDWKTTASPAVTSAFEKAKARIEQIITGNIPGLAFYGPSYTCGGYGSGSLTVDDLHIFVAIVEIDGPSGVLGRAGPCGLSLVDGMYMARTGMMEFDVADMELMESRGVLEVVVQHEM